MKFGEFCLSNNLIESDMLDDALVAQRYRPAKIGRVLRELGCIGQSDLNRALVRYLKPTNLVSVAVAADALKERLESRSISKELLSWGKDHAAIPFDVRSSKITFLTQTFRDEVLESGESRFEQACDFVMVDNETLNFILSRCGLIDQATTGSFEVESQASDEERIASKDPYTSLFRDAVIAAKQSQASDIHIEPTAEGVTIRFRIHGDLKIWKRLGQEHRRSFINQVKRLTNLSVAMSGRAQDGRVSFQAWKLDLRAGLLPSDHGEGIVLRLLDLNRKFEFSELGLDPQTEGDLRSALQAKNGLLIVSGPTGSGKTTTLYTVLTSMDRESRKIITLEDPIEYRIPGLTQVPITPKLSFASALRAVLRHDPDVILVGEIRDSETADLCLKAASTGHLVLSTVHANGAAEVISRLTSLGADPFLLKSVLRYSTAQRLVKTICSHCSLPYAGTLSQVLTLRSSNQTTNGSEDANLRTRNKAGCTNCQGGTTGRTSILEYMKKAEIQDFLSAPQAQAKVTVSLQAACLLRAEKGEVDVQDAIDIE